MSYGEESLKRFGGKEFKPRGKLLFKGDLSTSNLISFTSEFTE